MGYLLSGLYGSVKGKIGGVIFSNWKGINTAREYKIPANPQSVAQTAQRTKFAAVVALAQSLLPSLITTFWNPFAVMMSGFNAFIKSVFPNVTSAGLITAACKVTAGTLEGVSSLTLTYATLTGDTEIGYSNSINGNGLGTDQANLLVLSLIDNSIVHYEANFATRSDGTYNATLPTGLDATDLVGFVWFSRGTGSSFVVSDSSGLNISEP